MLLGFVTEDEITAKASIIIYAIYRSRDKKRGPSGVDMWSQIERFAKACAKRSTNIGEFADKFKRKMSCHTINPKWLKDDIKSVNAMVDHSTGSIITFGSEKFRNFGITIFESDIETQKAIVEKIYNETILIIMHVRDRIEREKMAGIQNEEDIVDET